MGKRCVVAGCSNNSSGGHSMHLFPRDERLFRKWERFVKLTRQGWKATQYSIICSAHFTSDCYEDYEVQNKLGFGPKKRTLMANSVPSILQANQVSTASASIQSPPPQVQEHAYSTPTAQIRPRTAVQRREHRKVLAEIFQNDIDDHGQSSQQAELQHHGHDGPAESSSQGDVDMSQDFDQQSDSRSVITSCSSHASASVGCQTKTFRQRVPRSSVATQTKPRRHDKVVQAEPRVREVGTQTDDTVEKPVSPSLTKSIVCIPPNLDSPPNDILDFDDLEDSDSDNISMYEPSVYESDESRDSIDDLDDQLRSDVDAEQKFIVFEENLLRLFEICRGCGHTCRAYVKQKVGSFVRLEQSCDHCGNIDTWDSQPFIGNTPSGNIAMSSSILFSGGIAAKFLRALQFMGVAHISSETYMKHQREILQPAILETWTSKQAAHLRERKETGTVTIGGDGRADTPGHSAKFGTYTLMDLEEGLVLDVQLVQSNEVKSSYHMEKEGLVRGMDFLEKQGVKIASLVTDRHVQIVKHVRENLPHIQHYFDVWHVAKGLKKKVTAVGNLKGCEGVREWTKSITNHLYWCAASTESGNGEVMLAKWHSLSNHIQNIHSGHGPQFPNCLHGPLIGRDRQKKWLKSGTKACEKLMDILESKQIRKDVQKLSPVYQTSELEAFHGVVNQFAPKMIGFSYHGMMARVLLAALHYNENNRRGYRLTNLGEPQIDVVYPKSKKGEHIVRPRKAECTFKYVADLKRITLKVLKTGDKQERPACPPPLTSNVCKVSKEMAISLHQSRFCQH